MIMKHLHIIMKYDHLQKNDWYEFFVYLLLIAVLGDLSVNVHSYTDP